MRTRLHKWLATSWKLCPRKVSDGKDSSGTVCIWFLKVCTPKSAEALSRLADHNEVYMNGIMCDGAA